MNSRQYLLILLVTVVALSGCATVSYYGQAVVGQASVLLQRRDIDKVIDDPDTSQQLRKQLQTVQLLRQFAGEALALPVKEAFTTYADTGREFVVWNVFSAPEFSLTMTSFCYPIAGCVNYRGYFSEKAARSFANKLKAEGQDVFVGGIAAYSTLGWFSDPILNTFVYREPQQLASLLFHELAHQVVYLPGDTTFNESFATAVAEVGVRRWLSSQSIGMDDQAFDQRRKRRAEVLNLISNTREKLAALYSQTLSEDEMRTAKQTLIQNMRQDYDAVRASWQGHSDFSRWMASDINNARLGTIADYNRLVPAFHQLLQQQGGDLELFYEAVKRLAALPSEDRAQILEALLLED